MPCSLIPQPPRPMHSTAAFSFLLILLAGSASVTSSNQKPNISPASRAVPYSVGIHPPRTGATTTTTSPPQTPSASPFPPPGLPIQTTADYQIVKRLGTGKFSDVFEAVDVNLERRCQAHPHHPRSMDDDAVDPRTLVVLKCLKPVSDRKIRREVSILMHASKVPNLVRLRGLILPPQYLATNRNATDLPRMPSLVLEHAGRRAQWLCHGQGLLPSTAGNGGRDATDAPFLSDYEIRYYLYHLLVALDGLHSIGIMHRDVKPRNVLINRSSNHAPPSSSAPSPCPLVLIDLGLSDFYALHQRYNVRVASRHYKSPELLVGYEYYHYSLDLWSVGCILVGLLLRREPFFRGKDNVDQLAKIVAVLGSKDLIAYMQRYNIPFTSDIQSIVQQSPVERVDWHKLVAKGVPQPSADSIDLLNKLLVYDHDGRLTAKQAMQHKFFDPVRDRVHADLLSYTTYLYPSSNFP